MNDFTKEELIRMKHGIEYQSDLMHYPSQDVDICNQLSHKIQSLIDNYCNHKNNVWPLYTPTGDIPVAGMCYECNCAVDRNFINE